MLSVATHCALPIALSIALSTVATGCGDDEQPADSAADATDGGTTSAQTGSGTVDANSSGEASTGASEGADETAADSTTGQPGGCWDDLAVGEVEVLYDGFSMGSEGLAFGLDGKLYATTIDAGVGTVWQIDANGAATSFAELPYALGLAATADGGFIVASIGQNMAPDGGVYRVDSRGTATLLTEGMIDSPNFVTITPDGSALISDDFDTQVFHVAQDGTVAVAIADVPSPNGMAYSPDGSVLYVASTFTEDGQLTRFDVDADGLPIEDSAIEILHLGMLSTPDGIAVDELGFVYVTANLDGEIWKVDGAARSLQEGELVADGLSTPASIAFGLGEGFDPCSIYATELFGSQVVRISAGVGGGPLYY